MTDMLCQAEPVIHAVNKPRIALMGEFSAGKSTLANLLLAQQHSPVQVTATQLPPVWYRHGSSGAHRVSLAGERADIPAENWAKVSTQDTQLIEVSLEADILDRADLIDMPGTSDPNLEIPYWKTILPQVDIAVWCTPANQAWRQSEAALWADVPDVLKSRSLLLITRMDKIRNAIDGARILQRVRQEAEGQFAAVLPVSLTQAMTAGDDEGALESCGAADLIGFLHSALDSARRTARPDFVPFVQPKEATPLPDQSPQSMPRSAIRRITPRRVITKRLSPS